MRRRLMLDVCAGSVQAGEVGGQRWGTRAICVCVRAGRTREAYRCWQSHSQHAHASRGISHWWGPAKRLTASCWEGRVLLCSLLFVTACWAACLQNLHNCTVGCQGSCVRRCTASHYASIRTNSSGSPHDISIRIWVVPGFVAVLLSIWSTWSRGSSSALCLAMHPLMLQGRVSELRHMHTHLAACFRCHGVCGLENMCQYCCVVLLFLPPIPPTAAVAASDRG